VTEATNDVVPRFECLTVYSPPKFVFLGWGGNGFGQLGVGDLSSRGTTVASMGDDLPEVDLGSDFIASGVSCGLDHTCAWTVEGNVKCWGGNAYGQVSGDGDLDGEEERKGNLFISRSRLVFYFG